MRVLLDSCLSGIGKEEIKAAGHEVIWSGDWKEDPGDETILAYALKEARVLVTLDKDFGELAVLRGCRHCGILRLVNFRIHEQAPVCIRILADHGKDLAAGAIITAEPGRLRIRFASELQKAE